MLEYTPSGPAHDSSHSQLPGVRDSDDRDHHWIHPGRYGSVPALRCGQGNLHGCEWQAQPQARQRVPGTLGGRLGQSSIAIVADPSDHRAPRGRVVHLVRWHLDR